MISSLQAYSADRIFDGSGLHRQSALLVEGTQVVAVVPRTDLTPEITQQYLGTGIISPGFVDLQVNGGGGVQFNDDPSVQLLRIIAGAHCALGATSILPTLITDTPAKTRQAVDAVELAVKQKVSGIAGLHLEGPHLSVSRKGAHDARLIRAMSESDLQFLCIAARRLPCLKVTLAPESVTLQQIRKLVTAGVVVALGHSNATFSQASAAIDAGASCVTHLYNAMSPLQSREPGLVGAALLNGAVATGLIADGVHVDFAAIQIALTAKQSPGKVFLVSDAMATAGSDIQEFELNGRSIHRFEGRLTLADGTLAGADLDLASAVRNLVTHANITLSEALSMATVYPANLLGARTWGSFFSKGKPADFNYLNDQLELQQTWQLGSACSANTLKYTD